MGYVLGAAGVVILGFLLWRVYRSRSMQDGGLQFREPGDE